MLTYHGKKLGDKELFLLNLLLILGKYHLHKSKWTPQKPNYYEFKIEIKYYMELIKKMENKKAIKTWEYYRRVQI